MGDDPARQRIQRIVLDDQQPAMRGQARGQIRDRGLTLGWRNVVHHIGQHDQPVIAMQLVEFAGEQAAAAQLRCNLIETGRRNVVAVNRVARTPLRQRGRQRANAATEIEDFRRRRAQQMVDVGGLVLREILGRLPAERDTAVEHGFVVRGKLIEFRHGSSAR